MIQNERLIRLKNRVKRGKMHLTPTFDVDEEVARAVSARADDVGKPVYQIRPYEEDGGVPEAIPLINSLHEFERGTFFRDATPTSAYEIWHEDGALTFNMVPGSPQLGKRVRDQMFEDYPNSEIRQRARQFPTLEPGQSFAGARLSLLRGSHLPIRHLDIDGFGGDGDVRDPFKNVLTRVTGDDDATVLVQFSFRPRRTRMTYQKRALRAANSLESAHTEWDVARFKKVVRQPDETDRRAASIIRGEGNTQGEQRLFEVGARILVAAPDDETAENRLREVVRAMGQYYEGHTKQGFYGDPALRYQPFLSECVERSVPGGISKDLVDSRALAGAVHLPDSGVNNSAIDRSHTKAGNPVPPRTPRFDFEAAGIEEPELATPKERWRAMVKHGHETPGDTDDAIWLGHGTRDGTEAGLPMEDLLHLAITGKSGYGKSKEALHIFYQMIERGCGAFYGDPKDGEDAALAVSLAMLAGRGDDIIPIRVGSDTDHQVTFNFLEVPGDVERGTDNYIDKLEPLADVVEGVLAQAGGTGRESWGERMSGITRHLVRGLGQLDLDTPPTLMSMNYAGATETDRNAYADYVNEQSIPFIEDTAKDVFADYDSGSIEPWARRVNQVVESGPLREVACNPHGFSLADAVREGKIIILFGETASDTALKMLMTALVPSLWTVMQELDHDDDEPDPPAFHAFVDELNDVVTPRMDLPKILSNARSYDFHLHGIFQDADSQVNDTIAKAFEGQADSLSVYPGTEDFAKSLASHHSEDVGAQELLDLPKFRQYIRTRDNTGEKTRSYPVNLGHPIHEIDDDVPDVKDALALVEQREQEIGHEKRTPEQIKADDPFASAESTDDDAGVNTEREILKAVLDESIHQDGVAVGDAVAASDVEQRLRDYLDADDDGIAKVWDAVDHVPRDQLARESRDGDVYLRCTEKGKSEIFSSGDSENSGGIDHRELLKDAYVPLSRAGLTVSIVRQDGDDLPDARAEPEALRGVDMASLGVSDVADLFADFRDDDPTLARLTGGDEVTIEAESKTSTKPGQTIKNLAQAVERGERCLFVAREDAARRVHNALSSPPFVSKEEGEDRVFYNRRYHSIDGEQVYRPAPANNTVWRFDGDTEEYVLADSEGDEWARFDTHDAIFEDVGAYPATEDDVEDPDDWKKVKAPVIPERVFDGELPDPEAWDVIVVPDVPEDEEADADDLDLHVDDGLTVPLTAVGQADSGEDSEEDAPADDEADLGDGPTALLELLRDEADLPVTTTEAHDLADESDALDVSRRTIGYYLDDLVDAGVFEKDTSGRANSYHFADE